MESLNWQGAQRVADWLVRAARPSSATSDAADFWYGATSKALAPILLAAACSGGTMAQVVQWVDGQEDEPVRFALEANGEEEAVTAFEAISMWDERTRGSVYATAQTVLIAYTDPGVLASAMTAELRAERLLDGGCHTAYLCAPAHEQRRLQPLFATLVQEIVGHAYDRSTETGKPLDPPLLLVLDECANIAPLRDLATLASTGAGQGIQLVSVFQDIAQINAVYGRERAPTIVSNHRAKVILSGIADPPSLEYLARLLGDEEVRQVSQTSGAGGRHSTTESATYRNLAPANVLREMRPGHGILVYGHLRPTRIALRPWFKDRRLRRLTRVRQDRPEAALS
jgi:type IV secretion system protein VirD4